jgi:hypothetical protein
VATDGKVLSNFELEPVAMAGQYGSCYHLAFPLAAGSYTVDIVGAAGSEPQIKTAVSADISPVPEQGTWLSPVWLGTGVNADPEAPLGSAFTVGGWHLTPISGPELTRAAEIAYFGFVVRPAVTEEGAIELRSRVRVKRDGQEIGRPLEVPLETSNIVDDLHMYGNSIGLNGFPETGAWELVFEIIEPNSGSSVERTLLIDLIE